MLRRFPHSGAGLRRYDPALYELLGTVLPAEPKWKDCYWYENE